MSVVINGTTGISGVNGSAGTPSVQGEDTNTGVFSPAADTVAVATGGSERFRLLSGNLLVGTTSVIDPNGARIVNAYNFPQTGMEFSTASTGAHFAATFRNGNGLVGFITTSGTTTSYNSASDYRLKENVAPMQNALDTVAQLNPVTYTWKADGSAGQGFIAHELQAVVPDCVTGEKDAVDAEGNPQYQGVDTSFLVATLVAAIKEQQATITDLKTRLTALEAK